MPSVRASASFSPSASHLESVCVWSINMRSRFAWAVALLVLVAFVGACATRGSMSTAVRQTVVTGPVQGPMPVTASSSPAAPAIGATVVGYFKAGITQAQISNYVLSLDAVWQKRQRDGQLGLIPFSSSPDYDHNLIRFIMFASSTPADVAAFRADLARDPLIDHVS